MNDLAQRQLVQLGDLSKYQEAEYLCYIALNCDIYIAADQY